MKNRFLALFLVFLLVAQTANATTTPNYSFVLPTVGASTNAWGGLLNTIFGSIDTDLWAASNGTTIGVNSPSASSTNISLTNPVNNIQQLSFSVANKNVVMPAMNATQSMVKGGVIRFDNVGSNTFGILAHDGTTVLFGTGVNSVTLSSGGSGYPGPVATGTISNAGSGYANGTYTGVPLSGGSGTNIYATVVVSGGAVTSVTIVNAGSGSIVADVLSTANTNLGGTGSGFTYTVSTLGTVYYSNAALTDVSSSGTSATANFVVTNGVVTSGAIVVQGSGYAVSDTLSAANTNLGGAGSGLSLTVSGITGVLPGASVYLTATSVSTSNGAFTVQTPLLGQNALADSGNPLTIPSTVGAVPAAGGTVRSLTVSANETVGGNLTVTGSATHTGFTTLTGGASAGTPNYGDSSTRVATTAFVAGSGPVQGAFKNLKGIWASNTTATWTADQIVVQNAAGASTQLGSYSCTINTAASAGTITGIDTGSLAASTWYYTYAIYNGSTKSCEFSLSSTSPTLVTGYTSFARTGSFYTDGSSNIRGFTQHGRGTKWIVGDNLSLLPLIATGTAGNPTVPTYVSVSVTPYVPTTASDILIIANNSNAGVTLVAPNNNYGTDASNIPPFAAANSGGNQSTAFVDMALESTSIYWANSSSAGQIASYGYEDNL